MSNLFSTFDPSSRFLTNWIRALIPILALPSAYWASKRQAYYSIKATITHLHKEFSINLGIFPTPGHTHLIISIFIFILLNNLLGLTPYTFTASRHLRFALTIGLTLWLGYFILSFCIDTNHALAHLLPLSTPKPLIPVIILIESIRNLIRPLTLSVRLAANIVAGHLLLSLISGPVSGNNKIFLLVSLPLLTLIILESAVAWIQAYVFSILSSLYINESNFRKLN